MAWTLHLLVWITVVLRGSLTYDRMDTRAGIASDSYSLNVPDDVKSAQLRIAETTQTRTESESKVLSGKPYAESRRVSGQNNDKLVFPGPTSTTSEEFELEIPENCQRLGNCDDVPNYPKEQANKVIAELSDLGMFSNYTPNVPDITQRVGPEEDNIELCEFDEKVVHPKVSVDSSGKSHVVLNQADNPSKGFKVEICKNWSTSDERTSELKISERDWQDSAPCSRIAVFVNGHQGRCIQKYVYREMVVPINGSILAEPLKVPSHCSCVARLL